MSNSQQQQQAPIINCCKSSDSDSTTPTTQQHKTCYNNYGNNNKNATSSSSTALPANTILITHNYSQDAKDVVNQSGELVKQNLNKSSSSITIVTHNNATTSVSAHDIVGGASNNGSNGISSSNRGYHHLSMEKMHPILNNGKNGDGRRVGSPVIVDSINICINNHFNEMAVKSTTSNNSSSSSNDNKINTAVDNIKTTIIKKEKLDNLNENESNSTTTTTGKIQKQISKIFFSGMDVLVKRNDEKYYLGTIVAVYPLKRKCFIKFDDNTDCWAEFDELTAFGNKSSNDSCDNDEPMCVICKKINKNDIVELCERCGRGCHRLCAEGGYNNGIWSCKRCSAENGKKISKQESVINPNDTSLPYDPKRLTWDNQHRVNEEQIYCYCGKTGRWEKKMLQCIKCQQWFHENCVQCLKYPLYDGDRFYIFACSICNGDEYICRLEMKWADIVHLILFNLTTNNQDKKYHHITKSIVPYAIENLPNLQLQNSITNLSSDAIKENIIKTLIVYKNRFKSCREIKKNNSFWGLRSRMSPAPPKISIPSNVILTDQYVKEHIKFNTIPTKSLNHKLIKSDNINVNSNLKFSSEDEIPIKNIIIAKKDKKIDMTKEKSTINLLKLNNSKQNNMKNLDKKIQLKYGIKKKKITLLKPNMSSETTKKLKTNQKIENINLTNNNCDSSDETSSLGTLDLIIPPPKNFQGRNNPFRFTPKKNETNNNNNSNNNNNIINNNNYDLNKNFDITSKLVALKKSVMGCNSSSGIGIVGGCNSSGINSIFKNGGHLNGGGKDFQAAGQFRIIRTIKRRLSAKDLVIGPNKEIKKRRLRRATTNGNVEVISTTIESLPIKYNNSYNMPLCRPDTFPTSYTSSICIKKAATTATTASIIAAATTPLSSSSTPSSSSSSTPLTTTPTPFETAASNLFNTTTTAAAISIGNIAASVSRRNLRKRQEKNYSENIRRNSNSSVSSTNCSNGSTTNGLQSNNFTTTAATVSNGDCGVVTDSNSLQISNHSSAGSLQQSTSYNRQQQQNDDVSISDLQNSVNMYFGAVERIKNGEKFTIKAKRKLPNGKTQYLIEWDMGGMSALNH